MRRENRVRNSAADRLCLCGQRESTSNDVVAERDVTDYRRDVTGGDQRSSDVGAVIEYDEVQWEQRNSHPPDGDNAEEMHEYLEADSGRGTSVDHGEDTT